MFEVDWEVAIRQQYGEVWLLRPKKVSWEFIKANFKYFAVGELVYIQLCGSWNVYKELKCVLHKVNFQALFLSKLPYKPEKDKNWIMWKSLPV